jgi:hypothetical protein
MQQNGYNMQYFNGSHEHENLEHSVLDQSGVMGYLRERVNTAGHVMASLERGKRRENQYQQRSFNMEKNLGLALNFHSPGSNILWEDSHIRICFKIESGATGTILKLYFNNKTNLIIINFKATIVECPAQLIVKTGPIDSIIESYIQKEQHLYFACLAEFSQSPVLHISFVITPNKSFSRSFALPVNLLAFSTPADMSKSQFISRWKQLEQFETQKIFPERIPHDNEAIRKKLAVFGIKVLEKVDPIPGNFVCAGIIHTQALQIGVMIRLEFNEQTQLYRLTVRSTRELSANIVCTLIAENF